MNIADFLTDAAAQTPDLPAIRYDGCQLSFSELEDKAHRAACKLVELGIERGDRVVLYLPNHPKFVILYYAIQKLGAVGVTLNALLTRPEIAHEVNHAGGRLLITTTSLQRNLPREEELLTVEAVVLLDVLQPFKESFVVPEMAVELPANAQMEPGNPAVILYTSGTLATPKGTTLTHGNVCSNARASVRCTGIGVDDRALCCVPLYHCFGQNFIMNATILAGAELILQPRFELEKILEVIETEQVTMFFGVPTMYYRMLQANVPVERLASVRYYFSAAATLPVETSRGWRERYGLPIQEGYGLTETSPLASYNHVSAWREGSVGQAIEGVEIKVVHPTTGDALPPGDRGEILIKGPNVMKGYFGDAEATAQVMQDGWFLSGDLGYFDDQGYLFLVGRLKEMINPGGVSVSPREVEAVLLCHPKIDDVAVVGEPDPDLGETIKALVVSPSQLSENEVIGFARQRLAAHKVPRVVQFVESIPRSPTGMPIRRMLSGRMKAPGEPPPFG